MWNKYQVCAMILRVYWECGRKSDGTNPHSCEERKGIKSYLESTEKRPEGTGGRTAGDIYTVKQPFCSSRSSRCQTMTVVWRLMRGNERGGRKCIQARWTSASGRSAKTFTGHLPSESTIDWLLQRKNGKSYASCFSPTQPSFTVLIHPH